MLKTYETCHLKKAYGTEYTRKGSRTEYLFKIYVVPTIGIKCYSVCFKQYDLIPLTETELDIDIYTILNCWITGIRCIQILQEQ